MAGKALYSAFFSYSHSADGSLAPAFRLALHRFAKPWYKTRALSVFLDQSSLSANPALWPAIERALSSSEYFVLFASPASAASPWVRKEIDWWLRNRSMDRMLVLLTDGELVWDSAKVDFDWQRTTSIASELSGRFPDEPLYVDLRWTRAADAPGVRSPKFRAAVLDVAAPLHGRSKDELDGEDIRQNRRTIRLARGAVILLTVLAGAAVWAAIEANQQRNEAERQTGIAQAQTAVAKEQTVIAEKQTVIAEKQRLRAEEAAAEARRQEKIAAAERDEAVRQRDLAQARALTAEANRQSADPLHWNLATLLAIESMRRSPTADNYEALVKLSRDGARMVARFPGQHLTAFSADGRLVAAQHDQQLVVREARGGRERVRIPIEGMSGVFTTLCFTPDATLILGYHGNEARLFDLAAGRAIPLGAEVCPEVTQRVVTAADSLTLPDALGEATNVHWSADEEFLAYGGKEGDGAARVVQSESWRQLARFAFPPDAKSTTPGFTPPAIRVHLSPNGELASATDGYRSAVFEIHRDRPIVTLPANMLPKPVALSRDGRRAAFRVTGKIVVVDNASGRELTEIECGSVSRVQHHLSADGRFLIATCASGSAVLHDVDAKRTIASVPVQHGSPVAVSRDGSLVFAGSKLLRGDTAREVGGGLAVALDPRGRRMALVDRSDLRLIDLNGIATRTFDAGIDQLESVAFSEDGSLLAAGGRNMRVKLFDAATAKVVRVLEHVETDHWKFRIHRIVFSPSGKVVATMADDPTSPDYAKPGTMRVFEVATGREVARIPFTELAHDLRFTRDDTSLEVAVGRRRIRWERYPLVAAELIRESCGRVQRNMSALEWARFMGGGGRRDTCPSVK